MVSPRKSRKKSPCFSRTRTSIPARASRYPSIIPAGPPPTIQHVPRDVDIWVVLCKCPERILPPCDAGDHHAWVRLDDLKLFAIVVDHEEQMSCDAHRGNLSCESAGAIRVHSIGDRHGHWDNVAVLAHHCRDGGRAVPIEGLRTDNGERTSLTLGRSNESGACECVGALQSCVGASFVVSLRLGNHTQR